MACFIVPAAEAVVVGVVKKVAESKKPAEEHVQESAAAVSTHVSFMEKLGWLFKMLIGGAVLLAFEHLWHGEIVPYAPFLTAMSDPADTAAMLQEMSTVGVTMAALITAAWLVIVAVSHMIEKRADKEMEGEQA